MALKLVNSMKLGSKFPNNLHHIYIYIYKQRSHARENDVMRSGALL